MFDQNNFEIALFIFVIIFSGVFYLPINFFEHIYAEKRNVVIKNKLLKKKKFLDKKRNLLNTVKNLTETSSKLSDNLQSH